MRRRRFLLPTFAVASMTSTQASDTSLALYSPNGLPSALAWYQFYEKRSTGRALGLGLIATSISALGLISRPWTWFATASSSRQASKSASRFQGALIGASLVAILVGIRLRTRKYYKDPEALHEYIKLYHESIFPVAFKQLDHWDGINRVATPSMIKAKLERELAGYLGGAEKAELKFDDVWQIYNELSGHPSLLAELLQRKLIEVDTLRKLALSDLEYSMAHGEETPGKPSAPPPDALLPVSSSVRFTRYPGLSDSAPRTLIYRMKTYHIFLQASLGIPASILEAALRNDPEVLSMDLKALIEADVKSLALLRPTPIFSTELLRFKTIEYLQNHKDLTFEKFIDKFGRWLIDEQIIAASDLVELFQRDCVNQLDCVTLLDKWYEWPIQHYGHSLGFTTEQQKALAALYAQLTQARNQHQNYLAKLNQQYDKGMSKAQKQREQKLSASGSKATSSSSNNAKGNDEDKGVSIPVTVVRDDGSVSVKEPKSATAPPDSERIKAEYNLEKMRLIEQRDTQIEEGTKSLQQVEREINEAWQQILHPPKNAGQAAPVQVNVNFSLFGGVSIATEIK